MWAIIIIAVLCLIGIIVSLVFIGLNRFDPVLIGCMCGGFVAGAAIFGGLGFLCYRHCEALASEELDVLEREDGEHSFYVGEGTLATFERGELRIHSGEGAKGRRVIVPYGSIKFYSVCTRRMPREKGEWSVVMEIPAHYLAKGGKPRLSDPPALIQTEGKKRLYDTMKEFGLTLIGEQPKEEIENKKFERVTKFYLADTQKRNRALVLILAGLLFIVGGFFSALLWETTIGAVISVVGIYLFIRALIAYVRAKAEFSIYKEGIYYSEPSGIDNAFLKWEEFSDVCIFEQEEKQYLRVQCAYGTYDFPMFKGVVEYLVEHYPEKCKE